MYIIAFFCSRRCQKTACPSPPPFQDYLSDHEREQARWHPERETLEMAAADAVKVLGPDHSATRALVKAAITMSRVDLWRARLAMKTLRRDQRRAIAEAVEAAWEAEGV